MSIRGKRIPRIGIRIAEPDLHNKLHYLARYEGSAANAQIVHLIRTCIEDFDSKHDRIKPRVPPWKH
jgi:hypothetical protein